MTGRGNAGHRRRLRERFLAGGAAARSDEVVLELLLAFSILRKDVRPLADELIRRFGSLSQVLSASQDELRAVKGVGPASIALLKAVDHIRSRSPSPAPQQVPPVSVGATQPSFFESLPDGEPVAPSDSDAGGGEPQAPGDAASPIAEALVGRDTAVDSVTVDMPTVPQPSLDTSGDLPTAKTSPRRKLQVSRSHLLEFNHFSHILSLLYENRERAKISRRMLVEETGLPSNHVESLISVGAAVGLIRSRDQTLTPVGLLVAEHDIFVEQQGTLEWCHYRGAGSYRNLIWFEAFNHLLAEESAMTQLAWQAHFEETLRGHYAERTIGTHVSQEVQFIVDAYLEGNFSRLELLQRSSDERLYRRRYARFVPAVFCAMIYDFCSAAGSNLSQVGEMAIAPGSPAVVFGLDAASFRAQIEGLHDRGWLRYETTHNLDQIRLKPGFSALGFLSAYFEDREPQANSQLGMVNDEYGEENGKQGRT